MPSAAGTLCSRCEAFDLANLIDADDEVQDVRHCSSFAELEENSSACKLCSLFFDQLVSSLSDGLSETKASAKWRSSPILIRGWRYLDAEDAPGPLVWIKVRCDEFAAHAYLSLYCDEAEECRLGPAPCQAVMGRTIAPADESGGFLESCIRSCNEEHGCQQSEPPILPKRVVDVGTGPDDDTRLFIPYGCKAHYTTLSHCWGPNPERVIRTTLGNLANHVARIPFGHLSKTFQDAIAITRSLGIRYLWIDSLCILQDSLPDWESESTKMGSIYANSYLTIAASGSADSSGGCFLPRPRDTHVRVKCSIGNENGSHRYVFVRPKLRDFDGLPSSPLQKRAWVTQERLLSCRTMHYDTDQLMWECRRTSIAQSGVPVDAYHMPAWYEWNQRLQDQYPYARPGHTDGQLVWDWHTLVEEYSRRLLTKGSDKFPAISAMAKLLEERSGEEYMAGLWKHELPIGLLWRRADNQVGLTRPDTGYRAPSWSWAALDGPVIMMQETDMGARGNEIVPCVSDLAAHVVPRYSDQRGMLVSGSLDLTGRLKRVDGRQDPKVADYGSQAALGMDDIRSDGVVVGVALFDEDYAPLPADEAELYCLKVVQRRRSHAQWFGLLLSPARNADQFVRVGWAMGHGFPAQDWFGDTDPRRIRIV